MHSNPELVHGLDPPLLRGLQPSGEAALGAASAKPPHSRCRADANAGHWHPQKRCGKLG